PVVCRASWLVARCGGERDCDNQAEACQKATRREAAEQEQGGLTDSVIVGRFALPLGENGGTRPQFRLGAAKNVHAMTSGTVVPCRTSLLYAAVKARFSLFNLRCTPVEGDRF